MASEIGIILSAIRRKNVNRAFHILQCLIYNFTVRAFFCFSIELCSLFFVSPGQFTKLQVGPFICPPAIYKCDVVTYTNGTSRILLVCRSSRAVIKLHYCLSDKLVQYNSIRFHSFVESLVSKSAYINMRIFMEKLTEARPLISEVKWAYNDTGLPFFYGVLSST